MQMQQNPGAKLTPLMKQYLEIKSHHADKILLFRMGDFYEMFLDDAQTAAPILNIALTQRNKKDENSPLMCGVPHHSIAGPINKLLAAGLKVAICEQIEDPALAQGIVKRAVTQILTPGVVYDVQTLEGSKNHFLAAYENDTLSFLDASTGENFSYPQVHFEKFLELITYYPVAEIVFVNSHMQTKTMDQIMAMNDSAFKSRILQKAFSCLAKEDEVTFSERITQFSFDKVPASLKILIIYLVELSGPEILTTLQKPKILFWDKTWNLSWRLQKHLEIFENNEGQESPTLFSALDRTQSSQGKRLLRQWVLQPLRDKIEILKRQEGISKWKNAFPQLKELRKILSRVGDLERRYVRLSSGQCNGRDLLSFAQSLEASLAALEFDQVGGSLDQTKESLRQFVQEIKTKIVDDPPLAVKQGHLIQKNVDLKLDELIDLSTNAQKYLEEYEKEQKDLTGITSLKVRYNNVFGYYIEVTHSHVSKVPDHYKRKQTLANAERYYTDELIELEKKILSSQTKRFELEYEIFCELKKSCLLRAQEVTEIAHEVAILDVITSQAWLSLERNFVTPEFHDDSRFEIRGMKHFVLEQMIPKKIVSNDIHLGAHETLLITGPNMAGKSTYMRQVALVVLLAQMGFDVPAQKCHIPVVDQIFTRIGANDHLSSGFSTFMVEMMETSDLVQQATERSLVILDEIGRGTSTYDGLSLAQSILEHLVQKTKCFCLFATHYHELTKLSFEFPQVLNVHAETRETRHELEFTYKILPGAAQKSFGVQVAKKSGLPPSIIKRANELLTQFENKPHQTDLMEWSSIQGINWVESKQDVEEAPAEKLVHPNSLKVENEIKDLDLNEMTPMKAMMQIQQWKEELGGTRSPGPRTLF